MSAAIPGHPRQIELRSRRHDPGYVGESSHGVLRSYEVTGPGEGPPRAGDPRVAGRIARLAKRTRQDAIGSGAASRTNSSDGLEQQKPGSPTFGTNRASTRPRQSRNGGHRQYSVVTASTRWSPPAQGILPGPLSRHRPASGP